MRMSIGYLEPLVEFKVGQQLWSKHTVQSDFATCAPDLEESIFGNENPTKRSSS